MPGARSQQEPLHQLCHLRTERALPVLAALSSRAMLDDLEDLEATRRRQRDEARRRRQDELQRRREVRERRRMRESSGSFDLLASSDSSPSPSPSPRPSAAEDADNLSGNGAANNASRPAANGGANNKCRPQRKARFGSDSDSDDDVAAMSRKVAERNQLRERALKGSPNKKGAAANGKLPANRSHLWSDDESDDDELDVRQIIARNVAREANNADKISSEGVDVSCNKLTVERASRGGDDESTPKVNNRNDAKSNSPAGNADPSAGGAEKASAEKTKPSTECSSGNALTAGANAALHPTSKANSSQQQKAPVAQREEQKKGKAPMPNDNSLHKDEVVQQEDQKKGKAHIPNDNSLHKGEVAQQEEQKESKSTSQPAREPAKASASGELLQDEKVPFDIKVFGWGARPYETDAGYYDKLPSREAASAEILGHEEKRPPVEVNTDPIVGKEVRAKSNVEWSVQKQCLLVRTVGMGSPKDRVAGFDLDQTLVNWRCAGWPSRPEHYELWSAAAIVRLRQWHDEGYKLVIFSNQGGVKSAFHGKKADTVRGIIDWVAKLVDRPLYAVCSTKKDAGYHKGQPGMWAVMEECCNCGKEVRPDWSFYVGDADGTGDEYQQLGADKKFAENVGKLRNTTMQFHTPGEFFGPSNVERRRALTSVAAAAPPVIPSEACLVRAALVGGYLKGPILLVLVGVQGSGKSTFCKSLIENGGGSWECYSQDTIKGGRPGTRQAVEEAARAALRKGKNVVIDRMHLDADQRSHFVGVAKQCQVPVHALVLVASKEEVEDRVKNRTNHPGNVEGESGAAIAMKSLTRLHPPTYEEGFALIGHSQQLEGSIWRAYQCVGRDGKAKHAPKTIQLCNGGKAPFPMVTFGTMNIRVNSTVATVSQALRLGFESFDTAPTYKNEREVGIALGQAGDAKVTIKVPKRAISPEKAREEVSLSLSMLQRSSVDVILLHWPCDCIEAGTLASVWKELEIMKKEGLCRHIGVCNFTPSALQLLLSNCTIKPAINQVERHPLLPQLELLEYCESQGIVVQAHTPLGGDSQLLLGNDTIGRVAKESGLSPAQVLLGWNVQHGVMVVTKCSSESHAREAMAVLQEDRSLSPSQMKAIDSLTETHRFVAPPFMYRRDAAYSWGDSPPKSR
ncbi:hypothetical protein ACHAXT_001413 [Thalassiosira profunda]